MPRHISARPEQTQSPTLPERLRNIRALALSLLDDGVDDLAMLASVFNGLKQLSQDMTAKGVAEAGQYYAESLSTELDDKASELIKLIEAAVEEAEGRAQ
jgi:hypothetical protein